MSYKIAAASSDGKVINQHFGKASQFLIFEVENEEFEFIEVIKTIPFCGGGTHNDSDLKSAVEGLKECRAVLISQIGNGAGAELKRRGIDSFEVHDYIEEALVKLIKYYSKQDGGNKHGEKN